MAQRLKKEKIETFRKQLLERRAEIISKISQATQSLIHDQAAFTDTVDQAAADTDRAIVMQMKDREREAVMQIDAALNRLESGSYGVCESCDEEIQAARMRAFPFTTLCIDCKAELESEGRRYPSRIA